MSIVATFSPESPFHESAGLDYYDGVFTILGAHPVLPDQVRTLMDSAQIIWVSEETLEWYEANWPAPDQRSRLWPFLAMACLLLLLLMCCLLSYCNRNAQPGTWGSFFRLPGTTVVVTKERHASADDALRASERCMTAVETGVTLPVLKQLAARASLLAHDFAASSDAADRPNYTATIVKAADLWVTSAETWTVANQEAARNFAKGRAIWVQAGSGGRAPTLADYMNRSEYEHFWVEATAMTREARQLLYGPWDGSPRTSSSMSPL